MAAQRRRVFGPDENVDRFRRSVAARALLAADQDVETVDLLPVEFAVRRHQGKVLRFSVAAVLQAAGDGAVELARQVCERLVIKQQVGKGSGGRAGVEQFVRRDARRRAAADAADVVHASLPAVQSDRGEPSPDLGHLVNGEPTHLHLLSRGQVAETPAVLVRQFGNDAELGGVRGPARHAEPQHEVPRRLLSEEEAVPLEAGLVVFAQFLPVARGGEALDVVDTVEAVLLLLHLLDFVELLLRRSEVQWALRLAGGDEFSKRSLAHGTPGRGAGPGGVGERLHAGVSVPDGSRHVALGHP